MSNAHVHPAFRSTMKILSQSVPSLVEQAAHKLREAQQQIDIAADIIRRQAMRIEALNSVLNEIAPDDVESEEAATFGLRIPQHIVIESVKALIDHERVQFAGILETKFADYVKRERDEVDLQKYQDLRDWER